MVRGIEVCVDGVDPVTELLLVTCSGNFQTATFLLSALGSVFSIFPAALSSGLSATRLEDGDDVLLEARGPSRHLVLDS